MQELYLTYKVTVKMKGFYAGTFTRTFKIAKAANTLKIKGKTARVRQNARTLKAAEVISFTKKGQGARTYIKVSGNSKININKKTGKITLKKGLKKGTYKVKI